MSKTNLLKGRLSVLITLLLSTTLLLNWTQKVRGEIREATLSESKEIETDSQSLSENEGTALDSTQPDHKNQNILEIQVIETWLDETSETEPENLGENPSTSEISGENQPTIAQIEVVETWLDESSETEPENLGENPSKSEISGENQPTVAEIEALETDENSETEPKNLGENPSTSEISEENQPTVVEIKSLETEINGNSETEPENEKVAEKVAHPFITASSGLNIAQTYALDTEISRYLSQATEIQKATFNENYESVSEETDKTQTNSLEKFKFVNQALIAAETPSKLPVPPEETSAPSNKQNEPTSESEIEEEEEVTPDGETSPDGPIIPTETTPVTPPDDETVEEQVPAEEPRVLVAEVVVTGADLQLERLVYNTVITEPGRTATRTQLQEDVNAIYATGFFANVRVIPEDTPLGVRITFAVEPNPILQDVVIETVPETEKERVLPQEIVNQTFDDQYNRILNLRDLQDSIDTINEWYSSNGYDLAQVIGAPQINEDGVVKLVISEGVIEDIQVRFFDAEDEQLEGGRTRDFIVTREMRLEPGDVFNRNTAQQDLQRVFGLGLFEDVRLSFSPGEDPSEVIVNVDVVEGRTGSVAAGAGISSTSGLFGTLSYQEQNLGGNNQTVATELQIGERELLFDVSFTDPWIATDNHRTSYTVNAFRRRTISLVFDGEDSTIRTLDGFDSPRIVRTGGGVIFVRPLAEDVFTRPDWRLSAGFNYQRVQAENADGDVSPFSAPLNGYPSQPLTIDESGRDDLFTFNFGASQDTRNNPLQPTSGSVLRLGMEQTAPIGKGSILFNRIRGSYSFYIPVNLIDFGFIEEGQPKPQALAFNVQAGTVLGDLPPYEAFVVGGSNSVRGYAEGQVGSGRSYFQATAEYRFPIINIIGAALFIDYGTLLSSDGAVPGVPSRVRGLPGSGAGYGLGIRIQSPVGPIRVDYGFNDDGDGRLHFGIGERF